VAKSTRQSPETTDERYMALALEAAQAGLGWTSPNPMVGCVLVRDEEVVGVGAHLQDGEEHSEVRALADAGDAKGATAYVTLEPCSHVGRQSACCRALIEAGVSRVVYGSEDVDPRTAGTAKSILEDAGISVTAGVLVDNCDRFLDYYLHSSRENRVFVHLKLAVSLDAKIACKTGHSQWLSGLVSLGYAHYLRQKYDAVLVGSGTILADNPRLTARAETMEPYFKLPGQTPARNPVRVVLDPKFGLERDPGWKFLNTQGDNFRAHLPRVVIFGSDSHPQPPGGKCESSPATRHGLSENKEGRLDLGEMLGKLWQTGIRSLLVEGGSKVAQEFIHQGKVDKISLVFTPRIIGDDALGFSPIMGLQTIGEGLDFIDCQYEQLDTDMLITGYFGK